MESVIKQYITMDEQRDEIRVALVPVAKEVGSYTPGSLMRAMENFPTKPDLVVAVYRFEGIDGDGYRYKFVGVDIE